MIYLNISRSYKLSIYLFWEVRVDSFRLRLGGSGVKLLFHIDLALNYRRDCYVDNFYVFGKDFRLWLICICLIGVSNCDYLRDTLEML